MKASAVAENAAGIKLTEKSTEMNGLNQIFILEIRQTMRAKWFWGYSLLFGALVAVMFALGVTESQIIGFVGLGRLMVTFIQICMAILPIFVLISTVRSVVGDRESNVLEYMMSLPVSLAGYFWGKLAARFVITFLPVFLALTGAAIWGNISRIDVPWDIYTLYSFLIAAMVINFLGFGIFISTYSRSQEVAVSSAFILWLFMVALLDLILLGAMLKMRVDPETVIGIAMLNPLQVFRTASMALFDPKLTVIGAASYYILDTLSREVFIAISVIYPVMLGILFSWLGYRHFKGSDIL